MIIKNILIMIKPKIKEMQMKSDKNNKKKEFHLMYCVSTFIFVITILVCACNGKNRKIDTRCPNLVNKAEYYNSLYADKEGPMGIKMSIEYIDSVYRMIQIVDEAITSRKQIKMFYGNIKQNLIASVSSSTDTERNDFEEMVRYRVTFEHIVKSKNTGEVILRTSLTPDEISSALENQHSKLDGLKVYVNTAKSTLPRVMAAGYIIKDILCTDTDVIVKIFVDESIINFDEALKITTTPRLEQAITLGDLTVGLTFWTVAAQVPVGFDFHFIGTKGEKEFHIKFSKDEVVEYNKEMNRLKEQGFK